MASGRPTLRPPARTWAWHATCHLERVIGGVIMTTTRRGRTRADWHQGLLPALVVALLIGAASPARAQARFDVSLTVFHDRLSGYGNWVASARFGQVWYPHHEHLWRPYRDGYWTYTDAGWTWVSREPWAWATYHYGRWVFDDEYGWIWVPDTVWGPAWVAWRYNDDYVGWAPLPPGVVVRDDIDPPIDPYAFVFVRTRYLCDPHLVTYVEPQARNVTYVRLTSNATRFSISGGVYFNRGVDVNVVSRAIGRPVPHLTVQATAVEGPTRVTSGHVAIYRPASAAISRPSGYAAKVRATEAPARFAAPDRAAAPEHGVARARAAVRVETPAAMASRHQQESRNLAADQAHERAALEKEHTVEKAHPPAGMTRAQVAARQETEHQAQAQNDARQKQALDARHAQEKQQQQQPAKGSDKGKGHGGRNGRGGGDLAPLA